jgi:taurine dioxygenase
MAQLRVRRIAYALGAEVRGVDLRRPLDDVTIDQVRQAWLEHLVLCFPEQDLSQDEFLAFARQFGELGRVGKAKPLGDTPYMTFVTEQPVNGRRWDGYKGGQVWHSDKDYTTHPSSVSLLNCKEIPEVGGDTMFANQYMAYESLSPTIKGMIEELSAIHDHELALRATSVNDTRSADEIKRAFAAQETAGRSGPRIPVVHSIVRVHDETRRKALFLGERIRRIVGMTEAESRPLLDYLKEQSVRQEFTYRHRWAVNDLLMWDNRCLLHLALFDYDLQNDLRFMLKCEVLGPESGYAYTSDAESASVTLDVAHGQGS